MSRIPAPPSTCHIQFPERVWERGPDGRYTSRPWREEDFRRRLEIAMKLDPTLREHTAEEKPK